MINELVQRFKIRLEEDGKSVKTVESSGKVIENVDEVLKYGIHKV